MIIVKPDSALITYGGSYMYSEHEGTMPSGLQILDVDIE